MKCMVVGSVLALLIVSGLSFGADPETIEPTVGSKQVVQQPMLSLPKNLPPSAKPKGAPLGAAAAAAAPGAASNVTPGVFLFDPFTPIGSWVVPAGSVLVVPLAAAPYLVRFKVFVPNNCSVAWGKVVALNPLAFPTSLQGTQPTALGRNFIFQINQGGGANVSQIHAGIGGFLGTACMASVSVEYGEFGAQNR